MHNCCISGSMLAKNCIACHFKNTFLCSGTDKCGTDGKHKLTHWVWPDEQCMFRNLNWQRAVQRQFSDQLLKPYKLSIVHQDLRSVQTWWRRTCRWHRRPLCSISLLLQQCQTSRACRRSCSGPETTDLHTHRHNHAEIIHHVCHVGLRSYKQTTPADFTH